MARQKERDSMELEALKIGYGVLLERVKTELQNDSSIKAVLEYQKADFEKRLKELSE
jgi:hypothetical protein